MIRFIKTSTFLSLLFGFIMTMLLWYIQMWTDPQLSKNLIFPFNNNEIFKILYIKTLWPQKIQIALYTALVLFIIQLLIVSFTRNDKNKKWLKSIIDHLLNEKFHGDLEHTRITIFKIEKGVYVILPYIWKCFFLNFFEHYKKGVISSHFKLIPNPFKNYLVMYTRRSHPYEQGTSTIFPVAKSPKDVCGVASHSLYIEEPFKVEVESISDISIKNCKKVEDISIEHHKTRIKKYMIKSKLSDFNKLKCFHRLSNHIWANPIYDKNENPWGVIVVDNESVGENLFTSIESDLISYTKIIELSIINLN